MIFVGAFIYFFIFSYLVSVCTLPTVRRWALARGVVASPKADRFHQVATPLLGGVAIIFSFYVTLLFNLLSARWILPHLQPFAGELGPYLEGAVHNFSQLLVILICGFVVFLLGIVDDFKALGPKRKFLFEVFIGLILYYKGVQITVFAIHPFVNLLVTVLWIVAITNSFNLLDNIDGLAGGVAVIASFILMLFCIQGGQILITILLLTFMGSVLGFLRYNYPPASIFMGDSGSLFLGFMMSTLTILSTFYYESGPSIVPVVAPLMILSVPIYDTVSVILIRIKNKKSIFVGDKNHFSHRLIKIGMTPRQAIAFIFLVGLCTGMAALTLVNAHIETQVILLFQSFLLMMLIHLLKSFKQNQELE